MQFHPTKDHVTIDFGARAYHTLILAEVSGKLLHKTVIHSAQTAVDLDLSAYPAGVYFVRLEGSAGTVVKKVVKE